MGESFGSVESVKAASDVYSPVAGKVTEVNANVKSEPSLINKKPTGGTLLSQLCDLMLTCGLHSDAVPPSHSHSVDQIVYVCNADGWLIKVAVSAPNDKLMDLKAYEKHCQDNAH